MSRHNAYDAKVIASGIKDGHVTFAARTLGVNAKALETFVTARIGKIAHAQDIKDAKVASSIARRALCAHNVKAMSKKSFDNAMTNGGFAFLAYIFQAHSLRTFTAMRTRDAYSMTDEQRTNISAGMKAKVVTSPRTPVAKAVVKAVAKKLVAQSNAQGWTWPSGFRTDIKRVGLIEALRKAGHARTARAYEAVA